MTLTIIASIPTNGSIAPNSKRLTGNAPGIDFDGIATCEIFGNVARKVVNK